MNGEQLVASLLLHEFKEDLSLWDGTRFLDEMDYLRIESADSTGFVSELMKALRICERSQCIS